MQIAIPIFPKLTALDAIGPYEVLQRLPDSEIVFIGHDLGKIRSDNGFLGLAVDAVFEDVVSPDVIVFPGGVGTRPLMKDERVLDWLRRAHETSRFTRAMQLIIEYDPQPPFDAGSVAKAGAAAMERAIEYSQNRD